jgi:natural product precursor
MKVLKQLKLNQLSKAELGKNEMLHLTGGDCLCTCACAGPSSTNDNCGANHDHGVQGDKTYGSGSGYCWTELGSAKPNMGN